MTSKTSSSNSSAKLKGWAVTLLKLGVTALFWLIFWEILARQVNKEILLPSPRATLEHLISLLSSPDFYIVCGKSLLRIMLGYLSGCFIGIFLAVLCHILPFLNTLLTPLRATVKATPVASFIIIAYMWLTKGEIPGFIAALIVIPIVWSNVSMGLENVDKRLIEVGRAYKFSLKKYLMYIYFPALKPYIAAAALSGIGLAWKSGIAAEVLVVVRDGIGGMLYESKIYFESADLFAITAVIIIISLIIEKLLQRAMKTEKKNDKS